MSWFLKFPKLFGAVVFECSQSSTEKAPSLELKPCCAISSRKLRWVGLLACTVDTNNTHNEVPFVFFHAVADAAGNGPMFMSGYTKQHGLQDTDGLVAVQFLFSVGAVNVAIGD